MHTYSIRAAATKTTGHYRRPGTMTTYCTGAPTDLHANTAQARRVCARCVKAEARDRAEATVTATAALAPETAGTLPAMVCIQHGADCIGDPKRRHNFHPAPTAAPHPIETYYTLDCNNHGATCDGNPLQRHDYRHSVLSTQDRAMIAAGTVPAWCRSTADDHTDAATESRQAAELITEAEATDGTWRGQWIGARDTGPTLFDVPAGREQGALFV